MWPAQRQISWWGSLHITVPDVQTDSTMWTKRASPLCKWEGLSRIRSCLFSGVTCTRAVISILHSAVTALRLKCTMEHLAHTSRIYTDQFQHNTSARFRNHTPVASRQALLESHAALTAIAGAVLSGLLFACLMAETLCISYSKIPMFIQENLPVHSLGVSILRWAVFSALVLPHWKPLCVAVLAQLWEVLWYFSMFSRRNDDMWCQRGIGEAGIQPLTSLLALSGI